jgi:hypothetical protein
VVGYEAGADFEVGAYAKVVSEFLESLGRVVFGARVFVDGRFVKPDLVGPWFIVAGADASFRPWGCNHARELVAVDLSASEVQVLPAYTFNGCSRLAAVSFPPALMSVGQWCFADCSALKVVDLAHTDVTVLSEGSFARTGLVHVSLPASLCLLSLDAFAWTRLRSLDLSALAGLTATASVDVEISELRLPREGFAQLAKAFLPGSRIGVLVADVDEAEIRQLLPHLPEWGIDSLQIVSSRLAETFEWRGIERVDPIQATDATWVTEPIVVTMTAWRGLHASELRVLRSMDMSDAHLPHQVD